MSNVTVISDKRCSNGHRMGFRTVPLPDCENMRIVGCEGRMECNWSMARIQWRMTGVDIKD